MRRKTLLIVMGLVLTLPACGPKRGRLNLKARQTPAVYDLAIFLTPSNPLEPVADACDVSVFPPYLMVGRNDKLTWNIINLCRNEKKIEVKDFVGVFDPNNKDPLEDDGTTDPKKQLKFKVKTNAAYDVYKYAVYRDGQKVVDPEIDVER